MRLSTADDPINEGEIVSWIGWLMDDDSFDEMVEEARRKHPIKSRIPYLSMPLFLASLAALFIGIVVAPKTDFVWQLLIGAVACGVLFVLGCAALVYEPPECVLINRHCNAVCRLCKIPFVLDYRFSRKLETSSGDVHRYCLSLSDENDNDDLNRVLDIADIDFFISPLPSKKKMTVMSRSAKVECIVKKDGERPTIKVHIDSWKEI